MSWFDGIIPRECRNCFYWNGKKWDMRSDVSWDDRCDYFLSMFPILTTKGTINQEKMNQLGSAVSDPLWHI